MESIEKENLIKVAVSNVFKVDYNNCTCTMGVVTFISYRAIFILRPMKLNGVKRQFDIVTLIKN